MSSAGLSARVTLIFLDSPGGNMAEALAIGRLLRSRQIWTQVATDDTCASACVLVLAAGVGRIPLGSIVIHSFYSPEVLGTNDFARADALYAQASDKVSAYLKEMRISQTLLDKMMHVPYSSARKLTRDELSEVGLVGLDPVYAQARKTRTQKKPAPELLSK